MSVIRLFLVLLTLTVFFGCSSSSTLPEFEYNGRERSHWIADRRPDYGMGRRDGCIVMGELKLHLTRTDPAYYTGQVMDASEMDTIMFSTVIVNPDTPQEREINTDQQGKFSFVYSDKINQISVEHMTSRTLLINMR